MKFVVSSLFECMDVAPSRRHVETSNGTFPHEKSCARFSASVKMFYWWVSQPESKSSTLLRETLKKLRGAFQNKRRGWLSDGVIFLQCRECHNDSRCHRVLEMAVPPIALIVFSARFVRASVSSYKLFCYDAFTSH